MDIAQEPRRTVWVVDDSFSDSERVRKLLAKEFEVLTMLDGSVALEQLASGSVPDLMLLDWVMPGVSGPDVCRYVRGADKKLCQIPIILLTAHHGSAEITEAFASGANDYVSKPFVDEELRARVTVLLEGRKLLERAERAEADLLTVLSTSPDPIFALDTQGKISFVNKEGLIALGRLQEDIIGRPFHDFIPGIGDEELTLSRLEPSLPLPDIEIGNKVFSPSVRILPSNTASTKTIALRDVTARRQSEARRLDFYSIIAHDLRTPISAVLLRLDMMFMGARGLLAPALLEDLRRSETNLRSLVGMINDFLELARLEGIGYKIERKPVEIVDLIQSLLQDFDPLFKKSDLQLKLVGFEKKTFVLGDTRRLNQVLSNLIGNAIKFTDRLGLITISLVTTEDQVEIAIEDTGRGIDAGEIPHLFKRFRRADESKNSIAGTGLGLMIVREIVEAHGGVIGVESRLGSGSRFWFQLPRFRDSRSKLFRNTSSTVV